MIQIWCLLKPKAYVSIRQQVENERVPVELKYIHYLRAYLIEHQQNFEFSMLRVLKSTLTYLPHYAKEKFIKQGCKIEN